MSKILEAQLEDLLTEKKILERDLRNSKEENEKLRECVDECLAVIAHIDPELYSASDAVRMISKELLKHAKQ